MTVAPAMTNPRGPPCSSTSTLRFVPFLPRSVGFLPTFFPPEPGLAQGPVGALPLPIDRASSAYCSTKRAQICRKTPFLHQRWNQRWTVLSSPNSLGSWFHWQPLRMRNTMPSKARCQLRVCGPWAWVGRLRGGSVQCVATTHRGPPKWYPVSASSSVGYSKQEGKDTELDTSKELKDSRFEIVSKTQVKDYGEDQKPWSPSSAPT